MIFEILFNIITNIISFLGYIGIFILMIMESMILPVPSEAVMPFAGFLIADGKFSWLGILVISSLASLIGSLLSYYIGKCWGRPLILKYGKYFLLNKTHLSQTERFFSKRGEIAIFIGRFIPVVRHLISIPAGLANMNLKKFMIYTTIGAAMWNMFLTFVGYKLRENWELVHVYSKEIDYIIIFLILAVIIYFIVHRIKKKRHLK